MQPVESNESVDAVKTNASFTLPRRELLASLGLGAAALAGAGLGLESMAVGQKVSPVAPAEPPLSPDALGWDIKTASYVLPKLQYPSDALEPHIDKQTMELHHGKHHQSYVDGLNKSLKMLAEIRAGSRDAGETKGWLRDLSFHGSGHFLHTLFWQCMSPKAGGQPSGNIARQIDSDFGSYKACIDQFIAGANSVEGGGWGILAWEPIAQKLIILQAEKHQNLTAWGVTPLLVVDVWEHAYYLKYKNVRKDYLEAFKNVIHWDAVEKNFMSRTAVAKGG